MFYIVQSLIGLSLSVCEMLRVFNYWMEFSHSCRWLTICIFMSETQLTGWDGGSSNSEKMASEKHPILPLKSVVHAYLRCLNLWYLNPNVGLNIDMLWMTVTIMTVGVSLREATHWLLCGWVRGRQIEFCLKNQAETERLCN